MPFGMKEREKEGEGHSTSNIRCWVSLSLILGGCLLPSLCLLYIKVKPFGMMIIKKHFLFCFLIPYKVLMPIGVFYFPFFLINLISYIFKTLLIKLKIIILSSDISLIVLLPPWPPCSDS